MGLKDNVAQLVAFERRRSSGSDANSQTSSEGSLGSLSGQKRRQVQQQSLAASQAGGSRHLRFDSSESEGEGCSRAGSFAKRRTVVPDAAAAAALEAFSIEDAAVQPGLTEDAVGLPDGGGNGMSGHLVVEDATEPADADQETAAAQGAGSRRQRLPPLVVANIHVRCG